MGVLGMYTADYQDMDIFDNVWAMSISSAQARTGTYSYYQHNYNDLVTMNIPATNEGYIRFATYAINRTNAYTSSCVLKEVADATVTHLTIYGNAESTASIAFRGDSGDTNIGTGAGTSFNTWNVWEIYWLIHNSTGRLIVKIDGVIQIDFTGDTLFSANGAIGVIDHIQLGSVGASYVNADTYYDDIIIRDDDWPGRGGVYVFMANAGSTTENWYASAGNPEDCVDDNPPDYADYIYQKGNLPGSGHLVGVEDISITPDTIGGVAVVASAKVDSAGTSNVMPIIQSGSTKASGDAVAMGIDNNVIQTCWTQNPDTASDWTISEVNALEAGVEIVGD